MVNIYSVPDDRTDFIFPDNKNGMFLRNVPKYLPYYSYMALGSRNCVVGIATGYGLDD
jgi:hypothetical protein